MRLVRARSPATVLGAMLVTGTLVVAGACGSSPDPTPPAALAGDRGSGAEVIEANGCTSCHVIPGIATPSGGESYVGPPLDAWSRRAFVAGTVQNNAGNLGRFLLDPDDVRPGSAMPDLGLTEEEVRDITAYLFGLS
ncbi:c-type cytochrome [soil metagenome]